LATGYATALACSNRQPAFLICTDPEMSLEELLQDYLWRWGIEVNFRDEKTLLGTGEAQVRTVASTHKSTRGHRRSVLIFVARCAANCSSPATCPSTCCRQKWRRPHADESANSLHTGELLRILRCELWASQLSPESFSHFTSPPLADAKAQKPEPSLPHVLFAAA